MLDLRQYNSLGDALRAALETWPDEICLIEADRERENLRLTYRQFKQAALPLARAMQDAGLVSGTRAAILMTNQSKWLISAYALFFGGGFLVPPAHKSEDFPQIHSRIARRPEAAKNAEVAGAKRWEEFVSKQEPVFVPRERKEPGCMVYSWGRGGGPRGGF